MFAQATLYLKAEVQSYQKLDHFNKNIECIIHYIIWHIFHQVSLLPNQLHRSKCQFNVPVSVWKNEKPKEFVEALFHNKKKLTQLQ